MYSRSSQEIKKDIYDAIIVGAGISGLSAAHNLSLNGYKVLVLEARNYAGGRIHTDYSHDNTPIELGAQWIHGYKHNPLTELAQNIGEKSLKTTSKFDNYFKEDGQSGSKSYFKKIHHFGIKFEKFLEEKRKNPAADDRSLNSIWEEFKQQVPLNYQNPTRLYLNSIFEQECAANLDDLSMKYFDSDKEFDGSDVILVDGYDKLISYLKEQIPIHFNEPVTEINYSNRIIKINTGKYTYQARAVIVTLPLGVLKDKSTLFIPPLPEEKEHSIRSLGSGTLNKVILSFPKIFWSKKAHWLEYHSAENFLWTEYFSLYPYLNKPILVAFNAGDSAEKLEAKTNKETINSVMSVLKKIFGPEIPKPNWYIITRWKEDSFAKGSYSYMPPNSSPKDHDILAKPIDNRVFFAGEATNRQYFATVHGAYLSGQRAANEVKEILTHQFKENPNKSQDLNKLKHSFFVHNIPIKIDSSDLALGEDSKKSMHRKSINR